MRDDVFPDAVIHLAGNNAAIDEVVFAPVGAVADDALRPGAGHAGHLQELIETRGVEIDARFGRGRGVRTGAGLRGLIRGACNAAWERAKQSRRQNSRRCLDSHATILCYPGIET